MLFIKQNIQEEDIKSINSFVNELEALDNVETSSVNKYITSLVSSQYQKAVQDIENTKVGHRTVRKRNLQQVMQESFFYGANRFGNNFIA